MKNVIVQSFKDCLEAVCKIVFIIVVPSIILGSMIFMARGLEYLGLPIYLAAFISFITILFIFYLILNIKQKYFQ